MPRQTTALLLGVAFFLHLTMLCRPASAALPDQRPQRSADVFGGYASTHILVKLDRDLARGLRASQPPRAGDAGQRHRVAKGRPKPLREEPPGPFSNALQQTWRQFGAGAIRPVFPGNFRYPELAARHGLDRMFVIELPRGSDTPAIAAAFAENGAEVEAAGVAGIGGVAECPRIPNDAFFTTTQWNMQNTGQNIFSRRGTPGADVNAPAAWEIQTGFENETVIAVLDSGAYPHVEFADRLLPGHNAVPCCVGASCRGDCDDISDLCLAGHGTHVTGIAAAGGNNQSGVAGMNWGTQILPIKVLGPPRSSNECNGVVDDLATAIRWATDWPCFDDDSCDDPRRVDVINMSLQYPFLDSLALALLNGAVNYAHDAGILLVAATGNAGGNVAYPAKLATVLAVGATTNQDSIANFSNHGPEVDVSAPGDDVLSTVRGDNYNWISGTSMACPHVAGLATLLKSANPSLTHDDLAAIILSTADDRGSLGWDEFFGFGRLNAQQALATALGGIVLSAPAACAVDARRPHDPTDASVRFGWQSVELTFPNDASLITEGDFAVVVEGGSAAAPVVAAVTQLNPTSLRVEFDVPLEPGAWTTIEHLPSGTAVRLGFLPGDANGDGVSDGIDFFVLTDVMRNIGLPPPLSSLDIDRSGTFTPRDLLELADLLNGSGEYQRYLGDTLPP